MNLDWPEKCKGCAGGSTHLDTFTLALTTIVMVR